MSRKPYNVEGDPTAQKMQRIDKMFFELYKAFGSVGAIVSAVLPIDLADSTQVTGVLPFANMPTLSANTLLGSDAGGAIESIGLSTDFDITGGSLTLTGAVAGAWSRVSKAAETSRPTNNTLSADPDLQFALTASKLYIVRGRVWLTADSIPDFKFRFTGPAAPTLVLGDRRYIATCVAAGNYTSTFNYQTAAFDSVDVLINGAGAAGSARSLIDFNYVIDNGVNAGTFAFEWAQNTSDAGACKVHQGSWMEYRRLN